jgi:hypothetical protein
MPSRVRPRCATLTLRLDGAGEPRESELVLATRDGEVVWHGEVGAGAWRAGLRLRTRCQGTWQDAHWLMTRTLLETELASHGLSRDGAPELDVEMTPSPDGVTVTTTCRVIPAAQYPLLVDTTLESVAWNVAHAEGAVAHEASAAAPAAARDEAGVV